MRDMQGHPPHFRFMHHASSTPCFLSLPPSSHEIVREINKNPPPPPFFLSFPRTIRLPSASGFLARRIYGGRSRARFPSLAEKPTQYLLLLLLRRMEKFLPFFPLALDPRSRLVFEGGLRLIPPPFQIRTVQTKILSLCLSTWHRRILLPLLRVTVSNCLFDPRVSFLIRYFSPICI